MIGGECVWGRGGGGGRLKCAPTHGTGRWWLMLVGVGVSGERCVGVGAPKTSTPLRLLRTPPREHAPRHGDVRELRSSAHPRTSLALCCIYFEARRKRAPLLDRHQFYTGTHPARPSFVPRRSLPPLILLRRHRPPRTPLPRHSSARQPPEWARPPLSRPPWVLPLALCAERQTKGAGEERPQGKGHNAVGCTR